MSWLFLPCKKWLCSGWYQGPDMNICLLGHWLLKSPCSGAFQQELQSGSWVTFQREQPTGTKWSPQDSRLTWWADHHTFHIIPWFQTWQEVFCLQPPYSKMFSSWTGLTMYPGGSLNPPTSVSGHRHATLYPTRINKILGFSETFKKKFFKNTG